jgi:hypothetical protein
VGFVVDKVALGKVFSEYFGFPCQSSFHQFLHNHHHLSVAGTIGRSTQNPTAQIKKKNLFVNSFPSNGYTGRAIAQAVSRRLPTAAARVQIRDWSCGILLWTKVALGQVLSENFGFPCQSTFHLLLQDHLHCHPRLAQ